MFATKTPPTPIPSSTHWPKFQELIRKFDEEKIEPSDAKNEKEIKDEEAFKLLHDTMVAGLAKGHESESKNLVGKMQLAKEADAIRQKAFGEKQELPIGGAKSLAFLMYVYLPFYKDSQLVQINGNFLEQIAISLFASKRQEEYRFKAEQLEKMIQAQDPALIVKAEEIVKTLSSRSAPTPSRT